MRYTIAKSVATEFLHLKEKVQNDTFNDYLLKDMAFELSKQIIDLNLLQGNVIYQEDAYANKTLVKTMVETVDLYCKDCAFYSENKCLRIGEEFPEYGYCSKGEIRNLAEVKEGETE